MKAIALIFSLLAMPALAANLGAIREDEIALWLAPVDSGQVLYQHRAEAAMNPASTMKLLTTWAGLQLLGPDYRWRNELRSDGEIVDGELRGNLYWLGGGDPRLDSMRQAEMLRQLRLRGIRHIRGDLVLDGRLYSRISTAEGFDADAGQAFVVPPDAHMSNLNVAWLRFAASAKSMTVALDPPLAGVSLDNRLKLAARKECGRIRDQVKLTVSAQQIRVDGELSAACDGDSTFVSLPLTPPAFAAASMQALWQQSGGSGMATWRSGQAPDNARLLWRQESDPLAVVIGDVNKYSNNTMARMLWLSLGSKLAASGDSVQAAEQALRGLLAQKGIAAQTLVLENGAGLSRRERLSAQLLGEVLLDAARGPYAAEFSASLPLAGGEGTLRRRFATLGPMLRLKTGTLDDVRALAGYWQRADGRQFAVVALLNSSRAAQLLPEFDRIVSELLLAQAGNGTTSRALP